ncbi:MAG: hypothetical protein [Bacteriophage sp.]|jgi:hypothetical protein|uniref:Uncharacterized protein n=1 Tax=Myoviridae sp. ctNQV2 TaxID=2827683 RepID=A0A8S5RYV8_9CAUD|nr:MAG: hypothetical protein [Bacteriophage sp.]UWF79461.1 MAG: hypothetical protein [Bacteriophage sp.]UWF82556.1 MAG: hypothetical protein [Bacteriophage sp.]DAF43825.1 MAG TPA: hypothetical protein [Myoviridae sp. ctNQV2]
MIDIDFNKVIHGEQILFNKCKGKTIKDTYIGNEILCIIFDDNSFVYLEEYDDYGNISRFEDVNINYSNLKDYVGYNKDGELYHSDVMSFMIKNELFVENELKEYLYPLFEEEKRKIIERELAEYERIKNKYNLN